MAAEVLSMTADGAPQRCFAAHDPCLCTDVAGWRVDLAAVGCTSGAPAQDQPLRPSRGDPGAAERQAFARDGSQPCRDMPRCHGCDVSEAIRRIDRLTIAPIAILTAESAPALKSRARSEGATDRIGRPCDTQSLIHSVHAVTCWGNC